MEKTRRRFITRVGCFSPGIMLATMIFEFLGAVWIVLRYRLNRVGWIIAALLVFLGGMQMSEYIICGDGGTGYAWAHVAYVSITMLPPLGVSLAMAIANKHSLPWQIFMYVTCAAFIAYWIFIVGGVDYGHCGGNYVVFKANNNAMWVYGTYYYVYLAIGTVLSLSWAHQATSKRTRWALYWLAIGYIIFITPTITVAMLDPATQDAIPSVMCGFAVLLAICLIFGVAPLAGTKRNITQGGSHRAKEHDSRDGKD